MAPNRNLVTVSNDRPQFIMSQPTETEINSAADTPMVNGRSFSVGETIAAANALARNDVIRLSKNMKLRMAHRGAIEAPQTWRTYDSYGLQVDENSSQFYGAIEPEARPLLALAATDDGLVHTPGTFSKVSGYKDSQNIEPFESILYTPGTSSSADDELVGPAEPALQASAAQTIINDMPGQTDGPAMTGENYLSLPGRPIVTSETFVETMPGSSAE
jgi:hypothetical protein